MGFTCSTQECEKNQANHLVADLNLPTTTLDKNYPSLAAFIAQLLPFTPPPTPHPILLHIYYLTHPQICPLPPGPLPALKNNLISLCAAFLLSVNK